MISVIPGTADDPAVPIVLCALRRSVGYGLVRLADEPLAQHISLFVSPREAQVDLVREAQRSGKVVIFGSVGRQVAQLCGLGEPLPISDHWNNAVHSPPAPIYGTAQSAASIRWSGHELADHAPLKFRPFLRFDFANEWNNLGYGRTTSDGGTWSMAVEVAVSKAAELATAFAPRGSTAFVTLLENEDSATLWWNRAVGPVDCLEWALVEYFLSSWRPERLPCVPVIEEIPWGFDSASTMRLDCDESISAARPLFDLYRRRGIPFSVAIKTGQEELPENVVLLRDILANGGGILSHSVTHAPNWGGSAEACAAEARGSSDWLETRLPGLKVVNAVSPFHQNPPYVPVGLSRAGLKGFVGGIVANDPEALVARGGILPNDDTGVVTHSQQCMLHGDCMVSHGDPLEVPKAAFVAAQVSRTLFGFLDHPFSPRYDYGWGSEDKRLRAHDELLDFIAQQTIGRRHLWLNEDASLNWIRRKSQIRIAPIGAGFSIEGPLEGDLKFSVRWQGRSISIEDLAGV